MKKFVLSAALVAVVMMSSCSTSEKKAEDEGAAIKARIENCTDPDSLKIYVQQARDYADKLVKDGDDSAAKAYLDEVAPAVEAKDPSATSVFTKLGEKADSMVNLATDSIKSKTEAAKESVKDAAEAGKEKASEAVDNAKEKAADVADKAKEKTADAVQAGADKLKEALGDRKSVV